MFFIFLTSFFPEWVYHPKYQFYYTIHRKQCQHYQHLSKFGKLTNGNTIAIINEKGGDGMVVLDTAAYLDEVCRMLDEGRENVPVPVRGVSMRPFLRDGDTAFLSPLPEKVKKGDILLFRRKNGQYVLHRVYGIREEGILIMLGDSQTMPEPVLPSQLRGKVSFVRCGGGDCRPGSLRWWFFAHPWRVLAPQRPRIAKLLGLFRKK
jgi:signal peptidase I